MHRYGSEIKLIVSDIDGTLLNSENDLHPLTEEAIRAVINDKRCDFTFSTGRAFPRTLPMAVYFKLKIPFIYSSGAIYDPRDNRFISAFPIKPIQIEKIANIAEEFKVGMVAHTKTGMFCQVSDKDWKTIASLEWKKGEKVDHVKRVEDIKKDGPGEIIRLDIFAEIDWLAAIWQEINESIPDVHAVKMKRSIEISRDGMHKGSALIKISQLLGIPLKNIMAVGDSQNDILLLKAAGYGVAMGTAPDALKEAADAIVSSADENGLVKALELISFKIRK
jgi:Cof subfamily protein (haloacid dehalogenase superfamily)